MQKLISPVTIGYRDLREGHVMAATVTCHIKIDEDGKVVTQLYRCNYPYGPVSEEGIPLGVPLSFHKPEDKEAFLEQLFPVVSWRNEK
jgi:hypothetical protein